MTHLSGRAFSTLKEALAYDVSVSDEEKEEKNNRYEIIEGGVPAFASYGLENLYGSLNALHQTHNLQNADASDISVWVRYRDNKLCAVLLFRINKSCLTVLTEMIILSSSDVAYFIKSIFSIYKKINAIKFNSVELPHLPSDWPHQNFIFSENYIINLPSNKEQYFFGLGRSTRKTIKSYGNKLRRDFPEFLLTTTDASDISREQQHALLIKLQTYKKFSMEAREKKVHFDEEENRQILALLADRGIFTLITINGKIRAGSIACRVGNNVTMLISAADPEWTSYRLNLLVCYWAVCACIQRGAAQCHLLWGRYHYKTQLGGVIHDLSRAVIYRSSVAMLANSSLVFSMMSQKIFTQCRSWLVYDLFRNSENWAQKYFSVVRSFRDFWRYLKQ